MSGLSLYRKYRPATFAEVVGQEHVTRTLANAIAAGKVSHAYLFAGSRGTGKTSTAKLLAKALNCAEGSTVEPCGKCESCTGISAGTSLDVIEMDAASNRGIDDIRDIRDKVAFSPVGGPAKVYILDEAHMLTKEASNAFLKVLEEPPAHVIFVLCTTEAHKVIPTIRSRCQKFEFRRPSADMVLKVLERIAAAEGIAIDEAGLTAIARNSAGAFRDAIGTLDQLASYCDGEISQADVLSLLGVTPSDLLFEAVDIVSEEDVRGALLFIDHLAGQGRDPEQFAAELIGHLRHIFLLQQLDDDAAGLDAVPAEEISRLQSQSRLMTPARVMRFIELLLKAQGEVRLGSDPRLQLELAFIAITRPEIDMSTKSLLFRLERLEKNAAGPAESAGAACSRDAPVAAADEAGRVTAPGETAAPPELTLEKIARAWGVILTQVKKKKIPLYSLLQESRPVDLNGNVLTIGFPAGAGFHKGQVEKPAYAAIVTEALKEMTGADIQLACAVNPGLAAVKESKPPNSEEVIAMIMEEFEAEEI